MNVKATTADAYKLLHEGSLALARAERQGIRVDLEYCEKMKARLTRRIEHLQKKFRETELYDKWRTMFGSRTNIDSRPQLSQVLYKGYGITPPKKTKTGAGATDDEALRQLIPKFPEIQWIQDIARWRKLRDTYLDGFIKNQHNGYLHPTFNLHTTVTYRSCVAKGTKVLVMRDFEEHPDGIPIEEVKAGDYVYCFDDNLNPTIGRVKWAGKTGHREVIRLHWYGGPGRKGYLDVTPEHLVRLIDGTYEQAQNLDPKKNDFRSPSEPRHLPRVRVLSCGRSGDTLRFTGHLKHGNGILEHRLIYEHFHGPLSPDEVVHHKNHNHYDHRPENLEKMTLSDHSRYHGNNRSEDAIAKSIQALHDNRHKIPPPKGAKNGRYLHFSRFAFLRLLAQAGGRATKVPHDFTTVKEWATRLGVDLRVIRDRYDKDGKYITRGALSRLPSPIRVGQVVRQFGINYKKAQRMLEERGFEYKNPGPARNPYGRNGIPGNHVITEVEWIGKTVDVYDLEVEEHHNFFANEICVHNSSSDPNFQNIPSRDKEARMVTRKALYPRPGHQLMEADFASLEVMISACYHKDPTMLEYLETGGDMHKDMAEQIFFIKNLDRSNGAHDTLRNAAKNGFVFPQFYGDYYKNNAESLVEWVKLPKKGKWASGQGLELPEGFVSDHLASHGIRSMKAFIDHLKAVEDDFWGRRFRVYNEWKKRWVEEYRRKGKLQMFTGFEFQGPMRRNQIINTPVQGAAFHCLLKTFIEMDKIMRRDKWRSRLIGQIHDSMVMDVHPDELQTVQETVQWIVREYLPSIWKWIIVPLDIEIDVYDVDGPWVK